MDYCILISIYGEPPLLLLAPFRLLPTSHRLKLFVPYLNKGEYLYLSVITTGNRNPDVCRVNGRGKGIRVLAYRDWTSKSYITAGFIFLFLTIFLLFGSEGEGITKYVPNSIYEAFGAKVINKEIHVAMWPLLHKVVGTALAVIIGGFLIYRGISRFRERHWDSAEK